MHYQPLRTKLQGYMQKMEGLKKLIQESQQQNSHIPSPPLEVVGSVQNEVYAQFRDKLLQTSPSLNNAASIEGNKPSGSLGYLTTSSRPGSTSSQTTHSRANTSSYSISVEKITCTELYDHLCRTAQKLLFLDIRPVEDYIQGHLSYKSALYNIGKVVGGVVNIEPEWLRPNTTSEEIEQCLSSFGSNNLNQKILFQSRNDMDMIVFYDSSTRIFSEQTVHFKYLSDAIYKNDASNPPKVSPKLVSGGFQAWSYFVKNFSPQDWIEIGEGIGIRGFDDRVKKNSVGTASKSSVAARLTNLGNRTPDSSPKPVNSGNAIFRDPENNTDNSSFYVRKEYTETKSGIRIPERQSSIKNLKEMRTTFDDPFFSFSRWSNPSSPTDGSTVAHISYPVSAPNEASKPQGLSKPLIALPQSNENLDFEEASKRFPEISLADLPVVQYPSSHTRTNSPAPFAAPFIYESQAKVQAGNVFSQYSSLNPPVLPKPSDLTNAPAPFSYQSLIQGPLAGTGNYGSPSKSLPKQSNVTSSPNYTMSYGTNNQKAAYQNQPPIYSNHQIPQKPVSSNLDLSKITPPPLFPKPQHVSQPVKPTAPSLPPKPRITAPHQVLIQGQNPMLLPSSPIQSSFGISGLRNLCNTCFMNSTIQCLSATIPLARYFLGGTYRRHIARSNPLSSNGRVADEFAKLVQSMWSRDETVVVPSEFKHVMGELYPSFAGNEQQDSQEFLSFLLDQLHEDLNIAKRPFPPSAPDIDSENYPEAELMELEWRNYRARNWSLIVDMFQGTLKSKLQCQTCGKVF
jgi:hypothetical protein